VKPEKRQNQCQEKRALSWAFRRKNESGKKAKRKLLGKKRGGGAVRGKKKDVA